MSKNGAINVTGMVPGSFIGNLIPLTCGAVNCLSCGADVGMGCCTDKKDPTSIAYVILDDGYRYINVHYTRVERMIKLAEQLMMRTPDNKAWLPTITALKTQYANLKDKLLK